MPPSSAAIELDADDAQTFVGTTVAPAVGRYQFIAELGQGGMATVYLAVHRGPMGVRKLSVVKLMRSDATEDTDFLEMFIEEARLACKLSHPNVVHTYEVGEDAGKHYIAMEYLEGVSLQQWINRLGYRKQFTFADHVRVLIEVLKGLQYAHDAKDFDGTPLELVHRDISPHNVLITYDGQVKVVDFGIAKAADSRVETRVGTIKGKVTYMSPEQALMGEVDGRADVYAVGVMFWEAASQRRRWKGVTPALVLTKLRGPDACIPPEMPEGPLRDRVQEITERALHANLSQRYRQASEMQQDLEALLRFMNDEAPATEVGRRLADVFSDERKSRQAGIQKQIRALDTAEKSGAKFEVAVEPPPPSALSTAAFDTGASKVRAQSDQDLPSDGTQVSGVVTESKVHAVPQGSKKPLFVAVTAAAVLMVAGAWAWAQRGAPKQAMAAGQVGAATSAPAPSTLNLEHTLQLEVEPAQASVLVNGSPMASTDRSVRLPHNSWTSVRATLPGYASEERQFKLDSDMRLSLVLRAEANTQPAAKKSDPGAGAKSNGPRATAPVAAAARETAAAAAPQPQNTPPPPKPSRPVREIDNTNPFEK